METRKACLGRGRNEEREDSQGWVLKTQKQIRNGLKRRAWQTGLKMSPGEKPESRARAFGTNQPRVGDQEQEWQYFLGGLGNSEQWQCCTEPFQAVARREALLQSEEKCVVIEAIGQLVCLGS